MGEAWCCEADAYAIVRTRDEERRLLAQFPSLRPHWIRTTARSASTSLLRPIAAERRCA